VSGVDEDVDSDGRLLLPDVGTADAADAEGGGCERFNRREGFPPGFAPVGPVGPVGPAGGVCDMLYSWRAIYNRQAIQRLVFVCIRVY
jgi:hypothetical protein